MSNVCLQCRSGTAEEVDEKMELLREILDLMEAGLEIVEAKKKERQEKNKAAKKKTYVTEEGQGFEIACHASLTRLMFVCSRYPVVMFSF